MDDQEIAVLIDDLRRMLDENGFSWAREQAESALHPAAPVRSLALALLAAAESVTVDLARCEGAMLEAFGVDEVQFKPDDDAEQGGDGVIPSSPVSPPDPPRRLRGPERREVLRRLSEQGGTFAALRRQINERD